MFRTLYRNILIPKPELANLGTTQKLRAFVIPCDRTSSATSSASLRSSVLNAGVTARASHGAIKLCKVTLRMMEFAPPSSTALLVDKKPKLLFVF